MTAREHLKRQGFDVFLPLIRKTKRQNGKFLDKKLPLFPGYLFIGAVVDPVPWKSVNGTRGISRAVTFDGIYRPINSHIIEGLKSRCDGNGIVQPMNDIVSGDRVKIERGPFSDFVCNVDEIENEQRAWVLIDLIRQQTRAEVSLNDLLKIY